VCGTLSAASGRAYGMWSWCVYVYVGVKQKGGTAWACKAGGLGARAVPTPVVRGKVITSNTPGMASYLSRGR